MFPRHLVNWILMHVTNGFAKVFESYLALKQHCFSQIKEAERKCYSCILRSCWPEMSTHHSDCQRFTWTCYKFHLMLSTCIMYMQLVYIQNTKSIYDLRDQHSTDADNACSHKHIYNSRQGKRLKKTILYINKKWLQTLISLFVGWLSCHYSYLQDFRFVKPASQRVRFFTALLAKIHTGPTIHADIEL